MNHLRSFSFLLATLFLLHGCGYLLQPDVQQGMANLEKGEYELDPRHTTVLFKVDHLGLSKFVGRFNRVDASLDFDPADPAAARLTAVIYTASIDVNDADFSATLAGRSWFNSERFPEARFVTRAVELVDGNRARFIGDLTMLGVTAPIALDVHFNGGADNMLTGRYTLGFSAAARFKRSQFGMDQYIPAVGDDVDVEVHAEFLRHE
ncbi:YceI family protein [Cellvibrio sp. ARAG 10.3]|uniref:YceI family protein n=1 Tax=Cellvibrio sp. ARAG 10.3 TaxID=3451358 RepID=UPI003F447368